MKPIKKIQLSLFDGYFFEKRLVFGTKLIEQPYIPPPEASAVLSELSSRGADQTAEKTKYTGNELLEQQRVLLRQNRIKEGVPEISPERMREAIRKGQHKLLEYLTKRADSLPKNMDTVMSPMDEARFFRLGEDGSEVGYGLSTKRLVALGKKLLEQGFPRINREEIDLVLFSRLKSFRQARPDMKIVGQHFPREDTGASTLEATEFQPVHIKDFDIKTFQEGIKSGLIDDIMISHASYEYDEDHFPGIDKLKQDLDLHPLLRNVDLNSLPASLNPLIVRYLREEMGHRGLIVPDWYNMGAIREFSEVKMMNESGDSQPIFKKLKEIFGHEYSSALAIILGVDAGVSFLTGIDPYVESSEGWEVLKKDFPEIYTRFEKKLNQIIQETFDNIKPKDSNVQLDVNQLTIKEKILFMVFNKKQFEQGDPYHTRILSDVKEANKKEIFKILSEYGTGDYDVWNRTGVMTLILRQKIIEQLTGEKFGEPPQEMDMEKMWFTNLMNNQKFRSYYDTIDWDSPKMRQMFTELKQELIEPPMLLASAT